jgi:MFS transporter, OCT family, solute carrier family 22 (organic cation transporter), member 4/5
VASFLISAAVELPSYAFAAWAIGCLGRHDTMAGGMLLGGGALLGCAFAPAGGRVALAAVGKFGVSGAFAIASVYTSELFPTLIRSAVLGALNQAARVGAIVAPFIVMAGAGSPNPGLIPFSAMGAACVAAGLLIFTLPETLGTPLPDTMADMVRGGEVKGRAGVRTIVAGLITWEFGGGVVSAAASPGSSPEAPTANRVSGPGGDAPV